MRGTNGLCCILSALHNTGKHRSCFSVGSEDDLQMQHFFQWGNSYVNLSSRPECPAKSVACAPHLVLFAPAFIRCLLCLSDGFGVETTRDAANISLLFALDLGPLGLGGCLFQVIDVWRARAANFITGQSCAEIFG